MRAAALLALLPLAAFSGCMDGAAPLEYLDGDFVVAAPRWQAGYTWTYEDSSHGTTVARRDGAVLLDKTEGDPRRVTRTVLNTSHPVGDYYFIAVDDPLDDGRLLEIRYKENLTRAGGGYLPRASPSLADGFAFIGPSGPRWLDELPFPLHAGDSWRGGDLFRATVKGRVMEGDLHRVHITFEPATHTVGKHFIPQEFDALSERVAARRSETTLSAHGSAFYGEEEGALVRLQLDVEIKFLLEGTENGRDVVYDGSLNVKIDQRLVHHSLSPRPETDLSSLPLHVADPLLDMVRRLDIATDAVETTILDPDASASYSFWLAPGPSLPAAALDPARFEVIWDVTHSPSGATDTGKGPRFAALVDRPGMYTVRVAVRDLHTRTLLLQDRVYFEAVGRRVGTLDREAGTTARQLLLQVDAAYDDVEMEVRFMGTRANAYVRDHGDLRHVSPTGAETVLKQVADESSPSYHGFIGPHVQGSHRFDFVPELGLGVGDDFEIEVVMRYPNAAPVTELLDFS